jgi:hypothetical protein
MRESELIRRRNRWIPSSIYTKTFTYIFCGAHVELSVETESQYGCKECMAKRRLGSQLKNEQSISESSKEKSGKEMSP